MRLWTVQPASLYEQIIQTGYYRCDENHQEVALQHDYDKAYKWLAKRMKEKIGNPPEGVKYPVWAWHTREGIHKRPDLRCSGYAKKGTLCVLLEIEIPDNQVVLTDFNAWHYVLNDWYYDDSASEAEWEAKHLWFDSLPKKKQRREKGKSWFAVFDVTPFNNGWAIRGNYIQATFWELKSEQIINYWFFTAR